MTNFILVNPNTNAATTAVMVEIARAIAPNVNVEGVTAPFGAPLITNEAALDEAAGAVVSLETEDALRTADGVIIAAFGDPGLQALRTRITAPVTGIAEAGMAEAGANGRRFAVVTTTPDLVAAIARRAVLYGHERTFAGTWLTPGDPLDVMGDPQRLVTALAEACQQARISGGVDAVLIGGGPLAVAARVLADRLGMTITEPVPAAVRLAVRRTANGPL